MTVKEYNEMEKPAYCKSTAKDTDLVCKISGYIFLVQRTNDFNNVIMFRTTKTTRSIVTVLAKFREFCIKNGVEYLRLEMHKNRQLEKVFKFWQKEHNDESELNIVFAPRETVECCEYVYYVRLV